jgi:hypothetical protein
LGDEGLAHSLEDRGKLEDRELAHALGNTGSLEGGRLEQQLVDKELTVLRGRVYLI